MARVLAAVASILLVAGCGASARPADTRVPAALWREARPIGPGPEFHPPATGPVPGRCRARLGPRDGVHIELFARNRVVLVPAAIGVQPPLRYLSGRIVGARCYGDLVTLEPTGVVLVRRGARPRLRDLFRAWGQPLSATRVAAFRAAPGTRVAIFVDGRRRGGSATGVRLTRHAEIVLEVGPYVPPHAAYTFPPGA